ncbi:hypothetical protein [Arenibaculum pallidiluteum]|uniref:hypothetical protein n=1 Tax=Arenibaculum pallidiluteum TaxID=2812559 RepID=UPI001A978F80|nr:hypothetical protein [Arenibaculum pallidiluteum]
MQRFPAMRALILASAILPSALLLGGLPAIPAAAQQDCARRVEELATRNDLDAGVPVARGDETGEELTDKLAQSGGVIAPPLGTGGSTPTITPPPAGPNSMPTAPAIEPQAGAQGGTVSPEPRASVRLQAEAMLSSARIAAQRGDEAECRRQLEQATALLSGRSG